MSQTLVCPVVADSFETSKPRGPLPLWRQVSALVVLVGKGTDDPIPTGTLTIPIKFHLSLIFFTPFHRSLVNG